MVLFMKEGTERRPSEERLSKKTLPECQLSAERQREGLPAGRLPEAVWKRSVLKQIHHRREELLPMGNGQEYSRVLPVEQQSDDSLLLAECPGYVLLSSSVLHYAAEGEDGMLPLLRQLFAAGSEPIGMTAALLLPEGTTEQELRQKIGSLDQTCARYGLELLQVEPCVCNEIQKPLLQVTVLGREDPLWTNRQEMAGISGQNLTPGEPIRSARRLNRAGQVAWPGQSIVMAGWAGLEGTQRLLQERREAAEARFPLHFLRKIEQYDGSYLPRMEQRLALEYGATAMYAAGESGMMDALWQLGERIGQGLEIALYQIPIRQETVELTDFFGENPYQIASGGVFLMVTERGRELTERLCQEGCPAAVIGTVQAGRERVVCFHEERRYLEPYRGKKGR